MTSLEQTLAEVLVSIEQARSGGKPHMLKALLQRKRVICGALSAPEQSWLEPQVQASPPVRGSRRNAEKVLEPALCG